MIHNYSDSRFSNYYYSFCSCSKHYYSNWSYLNYYKEAEIMNVQYINNDFKTKQWMQRIKECRESGLSVRKWCRQNNLCEQTYYNWLKKLRTLAVESGALPAQTFVSLDQVDQEKENIIITRGSIRIEFPSDTDIETITRMIGALL